MQSLFRISLLVLLLVVLGECAVHGTNRNGDLSQQQPAVVEVDLQRENLASILASARNEQSVFEIKLVFVEIIVFSISQENIFVTSVRQTVCKLENSGYSRHRSL